jgi:type IV secretion system protein VirD4
MFGFWRDKYQTPDWRQREGTARWCKDTSDISGMVGGPSTGFDSIPLGVNKPRGRTGPIWNTKHQQGHGLCFAPNRTGKGASVIIPALLTYAGSMLVIDPKGENAWITAEHRRRMGHRVVILDPWDEVNRFGGVQGVERPTRYNPLSSISRFSRSFSEDVDAMAHAIIITPPGTRDDHWPDSARAYVGGVIALVKEAFGSTHRATLGEVRRLLTAGPDSVKRLAALVRSKLPESYAAQELDRFFSGTNEINGIISTALTQTEFLKSPILQDAMGNDDPPFDMDDFVGRPTTIYAVLPVNQLTSHARWLRLIMSLALRAVVRVSRKAAIPTMMLIDEMGTIGPLKALENAYGLLAGYDVRFFGFFQSLPQLQKDYPDAWSNFINNCSILQILAAKDATAEHFSKMLGTHTITEMAHAQETQHGRPLMYPHEMAAQLGRYPDRLWDNTQLIIYPQGAKNVLTLQNPYFHQPGWQGLYRNPPGHR